MIAVAWMGLWGVVIAVGGTLGALGAFELDGTVARFPAHDEGRASPALPRPYSPRTHQAIA